MRLEGSSKQKRERRATTPCSACYRQEPKVVCKVFKQGGVSACARCKRYSIAGCDMNATAGPSESSTLSLRRHRRRDKEILRLKKRVAALEVHLADGSESASLTTRVMDMLERINAISQAMARLDSNVELWIEKMHKDDPMNRKVTQTT